MAFYHICGRCERGFNWPTRQKIYCPDCATTLVENANRRSKALHRRLTRSDPVEVRRAVRDQRVHTCSSCGDPAEHGHSFCLTCAHRRKAQRDARYKRHARRFDASYPDRAREAQFDERYAPVLTRGGLLP